jgi:hypothetical protein
MDKPAAAAEVTALIVSYILETEDAGASGIVYCLTCKVGLHPSNSACSRLSAMMLQSNTLPVDER